MSLFSSLFGKPNFHRFDDSYTLDHESLQLAIHDAIQSQMQLNKVILLVVHFPATFEWMQDWIDESGIRYEVVTEPLTLSWVTEIHPFAGTSVLLALSDSFPNEIQKQLQQPGENAHELAIMVCERHPIVSFDSKVESFARAISVPTQLGYFICLKDPVVSIAISDTVIKILKQMGMGEQELVASSMVSKRLTTFFRRQEKKQPGNRPAYSQQEWLAQNWPNLK